MHSLRMSGVTPLLSLYAFRACTETHLSLYAVTVNCGASTCGHEPTQYFRLLIETNSSLPFQGIKLPTLVKYWPTPSVINTNASIKKNSLPLPTLKADMVLTYRQFEEQLCQQDQVVKCSMVYPSPILSSFRQTPLWTGTSHSKQFPCSINHYWTL